MFVADKKFMSEMSAQAQASERKRSHFNLHASMDEDVHRLCMAAEPGTYVRPHRHLAGDKWEYFTLLKGKIVVLIFSDDGTILQRIDMIAGEESSLIEIPADTWHCFAALQSGSIISEVKKGPYAKPPEEDWLQGTPNEGEEGAKELELWFRMAQQGDKIPSL